MHSVNLKIDPVINDQSRKSMTFSRSFPLEAHLIYVYVYLEAVMTREISRMKIRHSLNKPAG